MDLTKNRDFLKKLKDVRGIVYKNEPGEIISNSAREFIDITDLPLPPTGGCPPRAPNGCQTLDVPRDGQAGQGKTVIHRPGQARHRPLEKRKNLTIVQKADS